MEILRNLLRFLVTFASPGFFLSSRRWPIGACALLLTMAFPALAQRPPAIVPAGPGVVVEKLPRGYAALMPARATTTPAAPLAQVQQLLATSARTGDFRLAARADAILSRLPANDKRPAVLGARAYTAQHRHDFAGALRLLDQLVAADPRDGEARLSRAQVQLVQGRLDFAHADCTALLGIDVDNGLLCAASLDLRRAEYGSAARLLDLWLGKGRMEDGNRRYALVMRAEAATRAGDGAADSWYRRALRMDTGDVRTLAAYARYLRASGREREVEALLSSHPDNDGLQLQRVLAAYRLDPVRAAPLVRAQSARYALAHALGTQPEMRDEAEFLLMVRQQPAAALTLALKNFETQRDYEDVDLLQRAAQAADRADALLPLQTWAAKQKVALPAARKARR